MTDQLILDERLLGAIPSPYDPQDFIAELDDAVKPPRRYKATLLAPVLNQHNTPMCVAFASTGLKQWEERRDGGKFLDFDEAWLYGLANASDGIARPHDGTTARAALKVLSHTGHRLQGKPGSEPHYRIASYAAVPFAIESIKRAVMKYGPLLIASDWFGSWFRTSHGILVPPSGGRVGGHARLLFGWDDDVAGGAFLVRNSWGKSWGVNGNSYDPYGPFMSALHDCWRATDVKGA